ncbi:DUF4336 domain-containing protein [Pararhodobacter oceanensis]|uniref:DUF4336 domain-containing protein n=1 Tax=Pararhodobacter oceanensis TaxID=2172121 RepID=UPI003A95A233
MTKPTGYEPLHVLKPVDRDIWVVDGPSVKFYGLPFPTRMVVVRLAGGGLWLHSPVQPDAKILYALAELGAIQHLIAPNWLHFSYLTAWKHLFPKAQTWVAPGVVSRAGKKDQPLHVDHHLKSEAPPDWADEIDQMIFAGSRVHREAVFFHRASRTLILTDLIENFEAGKMPAWSAPLLKCAGVKDPDGKAPIDLRWTFRKNRAQARASAEALLAWHPERVIMAHGRWYEQGGEAELRRAFRWALG